jgi:hypothetical protein
MTLRKVKIMLHKQQLPDTEYLDLRRIYYAMIRFLLWLLKEANTIHLDNKTEFEQKFGKPQGLWFYDRVWSSEQIKTSFGEKVFELLELAKANPDQAIIAATYLLNDIAFYKNWEKPTYGLKFPLLSDSWKTKIHSVCIPFYEAWFSGDGFKKKDFPIKADVISRKRFMKAFHNISNRVCDYCDGERGDVGKNKEANDCEHFFPKSKFPHLCIHPRNLYVSCKGCNETWKLDYAPMGNADRVGLNNTYHPEYRPGAKLIRVTIEEKADRSYALKLYDDYVPERVETLEKSLDLSSRWSDDVNKKYQGNLSMLVSTSIEIVRDCGITVDEKLMDKILSKLIKTTENNIGEISCAIRDLAFLKYQYSNKLAEILAKCGSLQ